MFHQSTHFFDGFNLEPLGQSNAAANSGMFCTTPFTLKIDKNLVVRSLLSRRLDQLHRDSNILLVDL